MTSDPCGCQGRFHRLGQFQLAVEPDVTLSGGVKFTQQVSSHSDLDWNGFNLIPQVLFNMKFY